MKKNLQNIVAILIAMNIIFSSLGLNIFVHTCKTANLSKFSITQYLDYNCEVCSFCSADSDKPSCCSVNDKCDVAVATVNFEGCCFDYSKFIKLDFVSYNEISLLKPLFITLSDFYVIKEYLSKEVVINKIILAKHYSGISPPYESNYIHFLSSILE